MKTLINNNTILHYRVTGKGDPVIFLHGFLENHSMWTDIAAEILDLGFKTIVVDLPCHGESRFSGEVCTMAFMAECVDVLCKVDCMQAVHRYIKRTQRQFYSLNIH